MLKAGSPLEVRKILVRNGGGLGKGEAQKN